MNALKLTSLCGAAALAAVVLTGCGEQTTAPSSPVDAPSSTETAAPAAMDAGTSLRMLADDHAAQVLRLAPEYATVLGVDESVAGEGYNGRLGGYGFEAGQQARQLNAGFLREVRDVERSGVI